MSSVWTETYRCCKSKLSSEQVPGPWHTFELVLATLLELDPRPHNQILHGPGDQDISRTGQGCHSGGDVHRQSAEIIASHLALGLRWVHSGNLIQSAMAVFGVA